MRPAAGPVPPPSPRPARDVRPRRPRPAFDLVGSATSDHVTLIEFIWAGREGIQPVLFVERHYLQ